MKLAKLSAHGVRLKTAGYLPQNMPEVFNVRLATVQDNVSERCPYVADDYDGNGVVALKSEDFAFLES